MSEERMAVLEQLAQRLAARIVARVGMGWRLRLVAVAAGAAASLVAAGAVAGALGR